MITEKTPSSWRELQDDVAQVLRECGFEVEGERKFQTVRETTEIDVYAEETHLGRKSVILCECKHWKSKVPQSVVHSFRTTMADSGANVGYIIGSNGFQPGAVSATNLTNVRLRTWEQFQDEFAQQWLETHVVPNFWHSVDKFLTWTEPLPPALGRPLTKPEAEIFWEVWRSYQPLVALLMPFMPWARQMQDVKFPSLPLRDAERWNGLHLPDDLMNVSGYRELLSLIADHAEAGVTALRAAAHADDV